MKSYTDIEQSKKLAKILPIESADMYWDLLSKDKYAKVNNIGHCLGRTCVYAWSLAALLEKLKAEIQLENKQILFLHINKYDDINYEIRYTNSWTGEVFITEADNPVDACVAMIEKLHEKNLL